MTRIIIGLFLWGMFLTVGFAQLVEQRSPKPRAEGSNPSTPAKSTAVVIQMYRKTAVLFVCGSIR